MISRPERPFEARDYDRESVVVPLGRYLMYLPNYHAYLDHYEIPQSLDGQTVVINGRENSQAGASAAGSLLRSLQDRNPHDIILATESETIKAVFNKTALDIPLTVNFARQHFEDIPRGVLD